MNEFEIINKYFYPLVSKKESLSLKDDCAVFCSKKQIVVNVDTIIEKEHFFSEDSASSIASKLLGVNLSDIASMGGTPKFWTLAISLPRDKGENRHQSKIRIEDKWFAEFSSSLMDMQNEYGLKLISGDTTFSTGLLTLSANILAEVDLNIDPLRKSKIQKGDIICVSGFIGDSYWGLRVLLNKYKKINQVIKGIDKLDEDYLISRYQYPKPQIELGKILIHYANSCTDISDGLVIDIEKMCNYSKVNAVININNIPFSDSVKKIDDKDKLIKSITGGDDYELAFSISRDNLEKLKNKLPKNIVISEIGEVHSLEKNIQNQHLKILDQNNHEIIFPNKGYIH